MVIRILAVLGFFAGLSFNPLAWSDEEFPPEQVKRGEQTYAINCSRCHGFRLVNPGGHTFDLRRFPAGQRERFFKSVTNGKGNMPPWGDLLKPEQIARHFPNGL